MLNIFGQGFKSPHLHHTRPLDLHESGGLFLLKVLMFAAFIDNWRPESQRRKKQKAKTLRNPKDIDAGSPIKNVGDKRRE